MPGISPKQEKFCLLIVKGEPKPVAYEQAGYSCSSKKVAQVNACRLLNTDTVRNRIAELQDKLANRTLITVEGLTRELLEIKAAAVKAESFGPAVQAVIAVARLHGFMVDRSEVNVTHRPAPLPTKVLELSEEEWMRQFSITTARE